MIVNDDTHLTMFLPGPFSNGSQPRALVGGMGGPSGPLVRRGQFRDWYWRTKRTSCKKTTGRWSVITCWVLETTSSKFGWKGVYIQGDIITRANRIPFIIINWTIGVTKNNCWPFKLVRALRNSRRRAGAMYRTAIFTKYFWIWTVF